MSVRRGSHFPHGQEDFLLNDDVDPNPANKVSRLAIRQRWQSGSSSMKMTSFDSYVPPALLFAVSDVDQAIPSLNHRFLVERPAE
jgi:hypothetical protein